LLRHKVILFCQTIALARTGLLIFAVTTGMLVFWGLFGTSALYHHWPSTADLGGVQNTHTCAITSTVSTTNPAIPFSEFVDLRQLSCAGKSVLASFANLKAIHEGALGLAQRRDDGTSGKMMIEGAIAMLFIIAVTAGALTASMMINRLSEMRSVARRPT